MLVMTIIQIKTYISANTPY